MTIREESAFEGLILRTHPSRESDLVLVVLSPTLGKVSLLAKHARKSTKRYSTKFDVFDCGAFDCVRTKGKLAIVQDFHAKGGFPHLRESLEKITVASLLCEVTDILTFDDIDNAATLFDLITLTLKAVQESKDFKEILRATYLSLARLLAISGYASPLEHEPPSAHRLRSLIEMIEQVSEREIKSKELLFPLIDSLKR